MKLSALGLFLLLLFLFPLVSVRSEEPSSLEEVPLMERQIYQERLNELEAIFFNLQKINDYITNNSDLTLNQLDLLWKRLEQESIRFETVLQSLTPQQQSSPILMNWLERLPQTLEEASTLLTNYAERVRALEAENRKLTRQRNAAAGTSGGLAVVVIVLSLILAFGG